MSIHIGISFLPGLGQNVFPFGPSRETYGFDCLDLERFDDGLHLRLPMNGYKLVSFLIFLSRWNNEQITDELHQAVFAILTRFTQRKENFAGDGFLIKPA